MGVVKASLTHSAYNYNLQAHVEYFSYIFKIYSPNL